MIDGVASVNRKNRIEGTPGCADGGERISRSGPNPPDGSAARGARVVRFARFFGRAGTGSRKGDGRARDNSGILEKIVNWSPAHAHPQITRESVHTRRENVVGRARRGIESEQGC